MRADVFRIPTCWLSVYGSVQRSRVCVTAELSKMLEWHVPTNRDELLPFESDKIDKAR